jgi:MSHA pilin protein MshD
MRATRYSTRNNRHRAHGFSLIETIVVVVIMSIAFGTIAIAIDRAATQSASALPTKQALAIAESLLEEVMSRRFADSVTPPLPTPPIVIGGASPDRRIDSHDVTDYSGLVMTGIRQLADGDPVIPGLSAYNATITVADLAFAGLAATESKLITVLVTGPYGVNVRLEGVMVNTDPS